MIALTWGEGEAQAAGWPPPPPTAARGRLHPPLQAPRNSEKEPLTIQEWVLGGAAPCQQAHQCGPAVLLCAVSCGETFKRLVGWHV